MRCVLERERLALSPSCLRLLLFFGYLRLTYYILKTLSVHKNMMTRIKAQPLVNLIYLMECVCVS